jgi:hypothetical protein
MKQIKPAPGKKIRNPANNMSYLDPNGEPVRWDVFWQRRLNEGDIVVDDLPSAAPKQPPIVTQKVPTVKNEVND